MYWGVKKDKEEKGKDDTLPINAGGPDNSNVELVNNRIYYYSDISDDSILKLNKNLQSLIVKAKTHSAQFDMPTQQSGHAFLNMLSPGGSVFAGLSGMDTMLEAREIMPTTTIVDGMVASAATFLTIVGKRRLMRRNSFLMIHQLSAGMWGRYHDMKDEMSNLDRLMDTIKSIYGEHTNVPMKEIDEILKHDIWWDAKTCLKYGIVDEII